MLLDINTWWQSKELFEKTFWVIAVIGSLFFIFQTIISFSAGDGDTDTGFDDSLGGDSIDSFDGDHGMHSQFFTFKNLIAFLTMFGWTGVSTYNSGLSKPVVILLSVLAGLLIVFIFIFIFRAVTKLKYSGTLQLKNAINAFGETYLFIPGKRNGMGKVHITIQGTLHELNAVTDDESEIVRGKLVKVVDVLNDQVLLVTSSF